jgi:hypothetical protein
MLSGVGRPQGSIDAIVAALAAMLESAKQAFLHRDSLPPLLRTVGQPGTTDGGQDSN